MGFGQPSLKGRALKLLSAREHSRAELERKLARHEEEPGQLARALDELQQRGFIDERRVAESVVHRRASRLGAARVRQELAGKGLAPELVAETLEALKASEFERAREVWLKKYGRPPADAAERARQVRFLVGRGFAPAIVSRVLKLQEFPDDTQGVGCRRVDDVAPLEAGRFGATIVAAGTVRTPRAAGQRGQQACCNGSIQRLPRLLPVSWRYSFWMSSRAGRLKRARENSA